MRDSEDGLFREKNRNFPEIPAAYSLQMNAGLRQKRYKTQPPRDPVNHSAKAEIRIQFEACASAPGPATRPASKRLFRGSSPFLRAIKKPLCHFQRKRHSGE